MKKILCVLASFIIVSCGTPSEIQKVIGSGYTLEEYVIPSNIEGPLRQDMVDAALQRTSKVTNTQVSYTHSFEAVGQRMIVDTWTDGAHVITLAGYELRIGKDLVLAKDKLCFGAVDGPVLGVENMNDMPLIKVRHSCSEGAINGKNDIYYDGKLLSQELQVDQVYEAFTIKNKIGYIVRKDDKAYILFNGQVSSPLYDAILVRGCCMNPYYFAMEEDRVSFLAIKEGKKILVSIKLPYL